MNWFGQKKKPNIIEMQTFPNFGTPMFALVGYTNGVHFAFLQPEVPEIIQLVGVSAFEYVFNEYNNGNTFDLRNDPIIIHKTLLRANYLQASKAPMPYSRAIVLERMARDGVPVPVDNVDNSKPLYG